MVMEGRWKECSELPFAVSKTRRCGARVTTESFRLVEAALGCQFPALRVEEPRAAGDGRMFLLHLAVILYIDR